MRRGFGMAVLAIALWLAAVAGWIAAFGGKDHARPSDCAIVLGAAAYGSKPSPVFAERINHAVELHRAGVVKYLLFTGGRVTPADKSESAVDWRHSAADIARRIRAFDPFPGASTTLGTDTLKLWGAVVDDSADSIEVNTNERYGRILFINTSGVGVQTGEGVLVLTHLQRAGGKRLPASDFLRGCPLNPGMVLGTPAD